MKSSNFLHNLIQKILILGFAFSFAFVFTYVPQNWNQIEQAHASIDATEATQWLNNGLLSVGNAISAASSALLSSIQLKEFVLDPIAWTVVKGIISTMVNSIINWINSGFQGSPMFIQDISDYMLSLGDRVFGEFINELGVAPYVCSPFRLDLQFALSSSYSLLRSGSGGIPPAACGMSDVLATIDSYTSGDFGARGWDSWYQISTTPEMYTPYGSYIKLSGEARARIANKQGVEFDLLSFADGFFSNRVCGDVPVSTTGGQTTKQTCSVMTPGKTISESLNKHLGLNADTLVTADEISEIIGSALVQLTNMALSGAGGLLGLSGNSASNPYGGTYTDPNTGIVYNSYLEGSQANQDQQTQATIGNIAQKADEAEVIEQAFLAKTQKYQTYFNQANISVAAVSNSLNNKTNTALAAINNNLTQIADIKAIASDPSRANEAASKMNSLRPHTEADILTAENDWTKTFGDYLYNTARPAQQTYINTTLNGLRSQIISKLSGYSTGSAGYNALNALRTEISNEIAKETQLLNAMTQAINNYGQVKHETLMDNLFSSYGGDPWPDAAHKSARITHYQQGMLPW